MTIVVSCSSRYFLLVMNTHYCCIITWVILSQMTQLRMGDLSIYNQLLESCTVRGTCYKYLAVTLTRNLTLSDHITRKARRLIGILKRQFYRWSSPVALSRLFVLSCSETLSWTCCSCMEPYLSGTWTLCRRFPLSLSKTVKYTIPSAA